VLTKKKKASIFCESFGLSPLAPHANTHAHYLATMESVTVRTRKLSRNALLSRRQMVRCKRWYFSSLRRPCRAALPLTRASPVRVSALLSPRQVVDVLHPGRKPVSKKELKEALSKLHKVRRVVVAAAGVSAVCRGRGAGREGETSAEIWLRHALCSAPAPAAPPCRSTPRRWWCTVLRRLLAAGARPGLA